MRLYTNLLLIFIRKQLQFFKTVCLNLRTKKTILVERPYSIETAAGQGVTVFFPLYRETGQIVFLPDAFNTAQNYVCTNSSYLSDCSIPISMTGISINQGSQTISVSVTANLSALLPAVLNYRKQFIVIGYAKGRLDGR